MKKKMQKTDERSSSRTPYASPTVKAVEITTSSPLLQVSKSPTDTDFERDLF